MAVRITHDSDRPHAAVQFMLLRPLPDYDLEEVEHPVPREVDGVLVTQGFRDLMDDARSILNSLLQGSHLEIEQLTGAICPDAGKFRPGLWLVLRETGPAAPGHAMSEAARARVAAIAEELRSRLQLS